MPAARYHHKPLVTHMNHNRLVIIHPRVWLPCTINLRLLIPYAFFKIGGPLDLPTYQYCSIEQEARTTFDQQLDALALQIMKRWRRKVEDHIVVNHETTLEESIGM